jgi:predicted RNase H-like HicB family nuclease
MSTIKIDNLPAFTYPMRFALTQDDKTYFLVTCRDLPQVITDGTTIEEARINAADALDGAIASFGGSYEDYVKQCGDGHMSAHDFWKDRMSSGKLPYPSLPLEDEEMITAKCDEE